MIGGSWELDARIVERANTLYWWAVNNGYRPRITSATRTRQQQATLYARYLRGLSPYPAAPPGHSMHERGLAFDIVSLNNRALASVWASLGGRWGGARDPVHFEVAG
jgi:hypothetical protein